MRVIVTDDSGQGCSVAGPERLDLCEEPAGIDRIDAARRYPAFRGLLLNLNSDESPFATFGCKVWTEDGEGAEPIGFASRIDLVISQGADRLGRAQYHEMATRLAGLLEREAGDAVRAELHISPAQFTGRSEGFCLRLLLFARGAAQDQAQLRWSLGLVRVQQALLFLARAIRQNRVSIE
jgi:hypothetical protein